MRLIDADDFGNRMYHEAFEKDSDLQKWDSGCWIRYKLFENVLREQPTVQPDHIADSGKKVEQTGETAQNVQNEDLISRKWLVECIEEGWVKFDTAKDCNRMMHLVRDIAPSVQPEIIRCKDCKHRDKYGCCKYWKGLAMADIPIATDDNDFCSYAEQKGEQCERKL